MEEIAVAHAAVPVGPPGLELAERPDREAGTIRRRAPGAAHADGAGRRAVAEEPDRFRTCFERDLDRIQHSKAFRRLAGKCQVFVSPDDDHLRTRLTHAIEVCQVAVSIARPVGLDVALTAAAATGHDCGHGPAGHASEGALSPFVEGGYHHAVYGADVVLAPAQPVRGDARRHPQPLVEPARRPSPPRARSWPGPTASPTCATTSRTRSAAGIVRPHDLPDAVSAVVGRDRRTQLHRFITAMVETIAATGTVALRRPEADALDAFRAFNYERIYLRPESVEQADRAARLIAGLTEHYIAHPSDLGGDRVDLRPGHPDTVAEAVRYVSGMTDRFAATAAVELLGWKESALPRSA